MRRSNPNVSSDQSNHLPMLDGIRGIAALLVFFHHALFTAIDPARWSPLYRPLVWLSHFGVYGVDLFFVLSGYLITSILIRERESKRYFGSFYTKRVFRIIPIYAMCLAGLALFFPNSARYVWLCAFFIANFAQVFHVTSYGPFWTLSIEEQFYLIWPLILRLRPVNYTRSIAIAIIVLEPVLRLIDIAFHHFNFLFTFFHADGLAFGALLAFQNPHAMSQRRAGAFAYFAGASGAIFVASFALEGNLNAGLFSQPLVGLLGALNLSAASGTFYGLIGYLVASPRSRASMLVSSRVLRYFGAISYCMYMIHDYVFMCFDWMKGAAPPFSAQYIFPRMAICFAMTVLICELVRRAIEIPLNGLRNQILVRYGLAERSTV